MITRDKLKKAKVIDTGWDRVCNGEKVFVDTVEFEINYEGVKELEECVKKYSECVACNVHFNAGTDELNDIFMYVWDSSCNKDTKIDISFLSEDERNILKEYALDELTSYRNVFY